MKENFCANIQFCLFTFYQNLWDNFFSAQNRPKKPQSRSEVRQKFEFSGPDSTDHQVELLGKKIIWKSCQKLDRVDFFDSRKGNRYKDSFTLKFTMINDNCYLRHCCISATSGFEEELLNHLNAVCFRQKPQIEGKVARKEFCKLPQMAFPFYVTCSN